MSADEAVGEAIEELLTPEDAFAAMFEFLNCYWETFKTANVTDVLSEMQPAYGGQSFDPALWDDWLAAVAKVRAKTAGGAA